MLARLLPVGVLTLFAVGPLRALGDPPSPPPPEWQDDADEEPDATDRAGWPIDVGLFGTLAAGAYLEGTQTDVRPRHRMNDDPSRTGFDLQRLQLGLQGTRGLLTTRVFIAIPHAAGVEIDEALLALRLRSTGGAWLTVDGGVLRAQVGHQNALHLVQQWMPRRPAMASVMFGPSGLVAPGARAIAGHDLGDEVRLQLAAEVLSIDRAADATLPPQTFGGDGPDGPTPVFTASGRVGDRALLAEASATYAFGRMYFPDRTQLCTIEDVTTPCPAGRSHVYGGHLLAEGRPGGTLVRGVVEAFFRRVPTYNLTNGALYVELDAQPLSWLEAALRLDVVGVPADSIVLRKSQLWSASLAWTGRHARLRLSYQYDHKPQALKAPKPPAPPEVDGTTLFLQAEFGLGALADYFRTNH